MELKPTNKGLHALNLKENPEAAYLLLTNSDLYKDQSSIPKHEIHETTVHENYEGFTKQQIKNAAHARRLMGMIATPSEQDFQAIVRHNLLKDCPITNEDVNNAHHIFGPNLANIRGKMVHRKPEQVVTDYIEILQDFFT